MLENDICGRCGLCCKLTAIPELEKPVNVWCKHCDIGKGCSIYETRPAPCRDYKCAYYQSIEQGKAWPAAMRPDKSHVVVDCLDSARALCVRVDPTRPDAWKKQIVQDALLTLASMKLDYYLVNGDKVTKLKMGV